MPKFDMQCIIRGEETGGRLAAFREVVPPGSGPPLHVHRNQLEIFHVIEGQFRFSVDGELVELEAGGSAVVPAGAVHAFRNIGDEPGRIHFELLPAGKSEEAFERLIKEGDAIEDVAAFFDEYDMDLLGPPLTE